MKLSDYIEANKIKKDIFIALYNKDEKWIICGQQDDPRMNDYMNQEVELLGSDKFIKELKMINYTNVMQIGYIRMMEEKEENRKEKVSRNNKRK